MTWDGPNGKVSDSCYTPPDIIDLYLDDVRPCPDGWFLVRNLADAKLQLAAGRVRRASLDHDLGACADCTAVEQAAPTAWAGVMPNCRHVGTGYDLCLWMAETGHWPMEPPVVHSMNPSGAARMRGVIASYFGRRADVAVPKRDAR